MPSIGSAGKLDQRWTSSSILPGAFQPVSAADATLAWLYLGAAMPSREKGPVIGVRAPRGLEPMT